jgi:hypothetical protein
MQERLEESLIRLTAAEQLRDTKHRLAERLRTLLGIWVRAWTVLLAAE